MSNAIITLATITAMTRAEREQFYRRERKKLLGSMTREELRNYQEGRQRVNTARREAFFLEYGKEGKAGVLKGNSSHISVVNKLDDSITLMAYRDTRG